jgi:peroxiredoxin (alkyl hydroperoxide reductase subunit C)
MSLIGINAPNYQMSAVMPDGSINEQFEFAPHVQGRFALIFFYPMNYHPVATTEMIALDKRMEHLNKRNVAVIAISPDSAFSNQQWRSMPRNEGGVGPVQFPICSDMSHEVAKAYGVMFNDVHPYSAVFILDPNGVIRFQQIQDVPVGRFINSYINFIDAYDNFFRNEVFSPAGWVPGKPSIDWEDSKAQKFLAKHEGVL